MFYWLQVYALVTIVVFALTVVASLIIFSFVLAYRLIRRMILVAAAPFASALRQSVNSGTARAWFGMRTHYR